MRTAVALVLLGGVAGTLLTRSFTANASLPLVGTETSSPLEVSAQPPQTGIPLQEVKATVPALPAVPGAPKVEAPSLPIGASSQPSSEKSPVSTSGETAAASSGPSAPSARISPRASAATVAPTAGTTAGARTPAKRALPPGSRSRAHGRRALRVGSAGTAAVPAAPPSANGSKAVASRAAPRSSSPLDAIGAHIPLPLPVPDWSKPIILALLALALALGVRSRLAVFRARGLERERNILRRDIGAMQAALVPSVPDKIGGLAVSVAYRPAEGPAAGGDFYDVFAPKPGRVALILGDVAGHGPGALSQAALTRYTLRAYLQAGLAPRAAIALAGETLADPSGEHYATVIVGVYESTTGKLTCASAGHPPPILLGASEYEPSSVFSCAPIGWGIATGRRQSTISLEQGACVCLFSDGLIEARAEGEMLGREGLAEIFSELGPSPTASTLLESVRARVEATRDDMAACVLSPILGAARHAPHEEEIEVDVRAIGNPRLALLLTECGVIAGDIAHALALADKVAAQHDTAIMRVKIDASRSTIAVTAPAPVSAADHQSSAESLPGGARPLLHVVPGGEDQDDGHP